ncbi:MAG: nuclear transport factor 2 family protein [Cyclobacteriaceae bacterium]|jgi:hypothetical protein|nr:nuclear transport factor 2 family protein [Cyclobacteriaceae bacterium]
MHANEELIRSFYTCFQQLDAVGMKACYHDDASFSDPVFPSLKGKEISAMWSMLIDSLKMNPVTWNVSVSNIRANDHHGSCRWEADYVFSPTGRTVHNVIDARFEFLDGKIRVHHDSFDLYKWARMAFGFTGVLLGWSGMFRNKVRKTSAYRLKKFMERK